VASITFLKTYLKDNFIKCVKISKSVFITALSAIEKNAKTYICISMNIVQNNGRWPQCRTVQST
jgi:hypothetical protein